jgi:hypothetical protein
LPAAMALTLVNVTRPNAAAPRVFNSDITLPPFNLPTPRRWRRLSNPSERGSLHVFAAA